MTELGNPIHPQAIAGVDPEPGAVEADALLLAHNPKIGFDALAPRLPRRARGALAAAGRRRSSTSTTTAASAVCIAGLAFANPTACVWEAAAAIPFTAFCAAGDPAPTRPAKTAVGYRGDGPSRARRRTATRTSPTAASSTAAAPRRGTCPDGRARRRLHRRLRLRRLDRRLAPGRALPRRRRRTPSVLVLERGHAHGPHRLPPVDGRRPPLRRLRADPGPGRADRRRQPRRRRLEPLPRRVAALARARPSSAATTTPTTARAGGCGRARSAARRSTPTTRAPSAGLRVRQPSWKRGLEVGRALGGDAARGRPHLRPRAAGDRLRALRGRQVVLHGLRLRRQELADHQLPRRRPSAPASRSARWSRSTRSRQSSAPPVPLPRPRRRRSTRRRKQPAGRDRGHRVQGADPRRRRDGHAADPDALAPERRAARRSRRHLGRHLGVNGDHVAAIEFDPKQGPRACSACRGYGAVLQGQADHDDELRLLGRQARQRARRHPLHAPGDPPLASSPTSSTTTAAAPAGEPSWWGREKKRAISTWTNHIEILAMVEDTHDGEFFAVPPTGGGARAAERRPGRDRAVQLRALASSRRGSARRPTRRCKRIAERRGLGQVPEADRDRRAPTPRTRSAAAGWPTTSASASSTTAARCSATRASSAWTPRRSRPASASTRR